jgi:undecaprenyl-diphosphatase
MNLPGGTTVVVASAGPSVTRSPSDVLRALVAFVLLLVYLILQWLFGDTLLTFASQVLSGLAAIPHWIVETIVVGTRLLAVIVIVGGFFVTLFRSRWRMLLTVGFAAGVSLALVAIFDTINETTPAPAVTFSHVFGQLDDGRFPTPVGLAVAAAVVTAAAPWLSRRWRRLGWLMVFGLIATRILGAPISFDTIRSALAGWLSGAAALVVLGGPSRRPTGEAVAAGLAAVGVPLARLEQASVDARGSTPYFATGADGSPLFVKALGADERSADLLFRIYRTLQPRNLGDERPFSSLRRAVEHEALVAWAATRFGVRTPAVVGFATVEPNGFVLAYQAIAGKSLDRVDDDQFTDEMLAAAWTQIDLLRHHRIAHRDLRLANVFLSDDGEIWMIDFGFSELAASDLLLATDLAEFLMATSLRVGPERAVTAARIVVGRDALATAPSRLKPYALSGATRTALKERPALLDEVRSLVAQEV